MRDEIRQCLLDDGMVTAEQLTAAEAHAADNHITVDKALVDLKTITASDLGKCLSLLYKMPYVKLVGVAASRGAVSALSQACASYWNVYPRNYDPHTSLLTMAVADPKQAERMEKVYSFVLETYDLGFTIAPEFEIAEAIEMRYLPSTAGPHEVSGFDEFTAKNAFEAEPEEQSPATAVDKKRISSMHDKLEQKKAETEEAKPKRSLKTKVEPHVQEQAAPPHELLASITSAVSLLANSYLSDDPEALSRIRTRTRYCQLTAARLNLSVEQTTAVIMAAWLSGLEHRRDVIKQFINPYDLESIIFPVDAAQRQKLESLIVTLVHSYQDFEKESPSECADVNAIRQGLQVKWSSSAQHQDVLETFLQVLMDEQFLNKMSHHEGTLLLISPETMDSGVEQALKWAGYDISLAPSIAAIADSGYNASADLALVSSGTSSATDILNFCMQWKASSGTADIPLIVLLPEKAVVRGTKVLRAGADDFVSSPVDMELLYLKVEKQLSASASSDDEDTGVSGSLSDMSFCDMLQVLSASAKSMEIDITNDVDSGKVILKEGDVIHCEIGSTIGEQAFYDMMRWHEGHFSMKECTYFPEPTIEASTMSLLMEGARLADEDAAG